MPPEETITQELTDDAFDLAFEAAAGAVIPDPPPAPDAPAPAPAPAEPDVSEPPDSVTPEPPEPAAPVVPQAPPEPVAPPPPPQPEPPKGPTPEETAEADRLLALEQPTEEEAALIASVVADFPEVAQALKVQERVLTARFENLLAAKLNAAVAQIDQRMTPALATAQHIARSKHEEAIIASHADAFTILPKVEDWVNAQPAFLQPAYNNVLDSGTAAEVVALLTLFKKETGAQPPAAPAPPGPTPEEVDREKRLKSQEGVRGRHAVRQQTVDPNDFDGAFDTYAKA